MGRTGFRLAVLKTGSCLYGMFLIELLPIVCLGAEGVISPVLRIDVQHTAIRNVVHPATCKQVIKVAHVIRFLF